MFRFLTLRQWRNNALLGRQIESPESNVAPRVEKPGVEIESSEKIEESYVEAENQCHAEPQAQDWAVKQVSQL